MAGRGVRLLPPLVLVLLAALGCGQARAEHLLLQSTTSAQASGLFDVLLPAFRAATGIEVRVVAVGTGQALRNAADGNGDVVLVHAPAAEEAFVSAGHGLARHPVMINTFVVVGPGADPAGIAVATGAADAFARIARHGARFVSRGDDSGTHQRERELWQAAGAAPDPGRDAWYRDVGSGMDRALAVARELQAYTLSDEASWYALPDTGGLRLLFEGDPMLENRYSVILVDPARHPHVQAEAGRRFVDWLLGPDGQGLIATFAVNGRRVYRPAAADRP